MRIACGAFLKNTSIFQCRLHFDRDLDAMQKLARLTPLPADCGTAVSLHSSPERGVKAHPHHTLSHCMHVSEHVCPVALTQKRSCPLNGHIRVESCKFNFKVLLKCSVFYLEASNCASSSGNLDVAMLCCKSSGAEFHG